MLAPSVCNNYSLDIHVLLDNIHDLYQLLHSWGQKAFKVVSYSLAGQTGERLARETKVVIGLWYRPRK